MRKRFFLNCLLLLTLVLVMSTSAFAISESDVESAVSASGKEAVSGNVLVWFLCAIAFLKVSQKIDSFLSSLGLNVGHTGGSMLSEAMIAMRAINTATSAVGSALGSRSRHGSAPVSYTHLARVLCKADAAAVLFIGGGLHSRAGAGLFIPRREDCLFSAAFAATFVQVSAVAQKAKKENDIG